MSLVVVTGASGYLGGRLVEHLVGEGAGVRTVGREASPDWLRALTPDHAVIDGEPSGLAAAFAGAGAVVHLAAPNEVEASADPEGTIAATVDLTARVADAAATAGVGRLVYLSTVHVYGASMAEGAVLDEHTTAAPHHPYAEARLRSEAAAAERLEPGALVVLRLTNGVGAPAAPAVQRWTLLVNDLCREAATANTLTLRSAGDQWRDFVALADAVRIVGAATDRAALPADTYNLGSGVPTTVRAAAELVQAAFTRLTGMAPALRAPDPTGPAPRPYRVDVSRLADHGLHAETDLAAAIEETAAFCIEHRESLTT